MRIAVFVQEVLDADCPFVMTEGAETLDGLFLPSVADPAVLHMISSARAAFPVGEAEIVAVSVDPATSDAAIRKAIAYGADRMVAIRDKALPEHADGRTRGIVAAAAVKLLAADIALCGLDDPQGLLDSMGAHMAHRLEAPQVSGVSGFSAGQDPGTLDILRRLDHGDRERLACALPAVLVGDGACDAPPHPSFPRLLKAQHDAIEVLDLKALGLTAFDVKDPGTCRQAGYLPPRPRTKRSAEGRKSGSAMMASLMGGAKKKSGNLVKQPPEKAAEEIVAFLEEKGCLR